MKKVKQQIENRNTTLFFQESRGRMYTSKGPFMNVRPGLSGVSPRMMFEKRKDGFRYLDREPIDRNVLIDFKKLLERVYSLLSSPKKNSDQLNRLMKELYNKLNLFSASFCSTNKQHVCKKLNTLQYSLGKWLRHLIKIKKRKNALSSIEENKVQADYLKGALNELTHDILAGIVDALNYISKDIRIKNHFHK